QTVTISQYVAAAKIIAADILLESTWELIVHSEGGTLEATTGSINMNAVSTVTVNVTGGEMKALNGDINISSNARVLLQTPGGTPIYTNNLVLNSDFDVIINNENLHPTVKLSITAGGRVLINPALALGNASVDIAAGPSLTTNSITTAGNITLLANASVSPGVLVGNEVSITALNDGLSFNQNVSGNTSVSLTAANNITVSGSLLCPSGTVSLTSTNGSIGVSVLSVLTSASFLAANAPNGDVYVNNQSPSVRVTSGSALGTWSLHATGDIFGPQSPALPILAPTGTIVLTSDLGRMGSTFDRVRIDAGNLVVNAPLGF